MSSHRMPLRVMLLIAVRWSLKDLLVGITVGTVYLALVRFLILNREQLSLTSAVFPLVGLACVVPVFFAARCWKLLLVVVAMQVILTAIIAWIDAQQVVESLGRMDYFHARIGPPEPIPVRDIFFGRLARIASDVLFITVILLGGDSPVTPHGTLRLCALASLR